MEYNLLCITYLAINPYNKINILQMQQLPKPTFNNTFIIKKINHMYGF
jgi:hypothetical protein